MQVYQVMHYVRKHIPIHIPIPRGTATGVTGWICTPTLKSRGTSYVLVPPTFTTIYFDWLVPLHTHHRSSAPMYTYTATAIEEYQ